MGYNTVEDNAKMRNGTSIAEDVDRSVTASQHTEEIVDYPAGEGRTEISSDDTVEISAEADLNESESSISDSIKASYECACDAVNQAAIDFANSSKGEATLNAISKARVALDILEMTSDVDTDGIRASLDITASQIHMLRGETEEAAELNAAVMNDASTGFSTPAQIDFVQDISAISSTQTVVVDGPIVDYGSINGDQHGGTTVSVPYGSDADTAISIAEGDTAGAEGGDGASGDAGGDSGAGASSGGE